MPDYIRRRSRQDPMAGQLTTCGHRQRRDPWPFKTRRSTTSSCGRDGHTPTAPRDGAGHRQSATAAKNTELGAYVALFPRLRPAHPKPPNTTNADAAAADSPTRHHPDADGPGSVSTNPARCSTRFQRPPPGHVHWAQPQDERHNGRPPGPSAAKSNTPTAASRRTRANGPPRDRHRVPDYPLCHRHHPNHLRLPSKVRRQNLKMGPFGDPVVCTVSV